MSQAINLDSARRILNAAESLFAKHGYHPVTLRQITTEAQVNLAAVNYHFYDKESLYREVLTQRLHQINQRRTAMLQDSIVRAGEEAVPLPDILDAFARPAFLSSDASGAAGPRLLGRMLVERPPFIEDLLQLEFQPVMTRFGQAVRRHLPRMPPQDFLWRFSFIVGALHHALATLHVMKSSTQGICRDDDAASALAGFTRFATAALREPEDSRPGQDHLY